MTPLGSHGDLKPLPPFFSHPPSTQPKRLALFPTTSTPSSSKSFLKQEVVLSSTYSCSTETVIFPPSCVDGREYVTCLKDEVERTEASWKEALHGFFADKWPNLPSVVKALEKIWNVKEALKIFPRPDGSLIFLFNSGEERNRVLNSGPWFVLGRHLHLRPWTHSFRSRKEFFSSIPVWVHLPNLPLHLWSPNSIGRIVSVIGKPLFLNECSTNSSKLSYVQVCVEVFAKKPPLESVWTEVEGSSNHRFEQTMEYESKFVICTKCKNFGHSPEKCLSILSLSSTVHFKNKMVPSSKVTMRVDRSEPKPPNPEPDSRIKSDSAPALHDEEDWIEVHHKNRKNRRKQKLSIASSNLDVNKIKVVDCLGPSGASSDKVLSKPITISGNPTQTDSGLKKQTDSPQKSGGFDLIPLESSLLGTSNEFSGEVQGRLGEISSDDSVVGKFSTNFMSSNQNSTRPGLEADNSGMASFLATETIYSEGLSRDTPEHNDGSAGVIAQPMVVHEDLLKQALGAGNSEHNPSITFQPTDDPEHDPTFHLHIVVNMHAGDTRISYEQGGQRNGMQKFGDVNNVQVAEVRLVFQVDQSAEEQEESSQAGW